jgi:hypothetical protein
MLLRVNFEFPGGSEIRYLERLPLSGGVVLHGGTRWFVTGITRDESGDFNVRLAPTTGRSRHDRRRLLHA